MQIKLTKTELAELKKVLQSELLNGIDIDIKVLNGIRERLESSDTIQLFVDGAADLHTKTAGIGGVFYRGGEEMYTFSEFIGSATNNEAEYNALIMGLEKSIELGVKDLEIFADSELVVKQVNGDYKVRNDRMRVLNTKVFTLLNKFTYWAINHIHREKNGVADKLSKDAMRSKK